MNIIGRMIQLSFRKYVAYKANAVAVVIDTLMDCFSVWLFWASLLELDLNLEGWKPDQIMMFVGFSLIARSVSTIFARSWDVQEHILRGTLDNYLLRPGNPIVMMLLENANFLRSFISFAAGLVIVISQIGFEELLYAAVSVLLCLMASVCLNLIRLGIYELSFFLRDMESTADLAETLLSVSEYPVMLFGRKAVEFFTYILPVAYVGTIPVEMTAKRSIPVSVWEFGCVFVGMILIDYVIWKMGRNRYESTN